MNRVFEKYYNNEVKKKIYHWCPKNLMEWYNINEEKLFNILEDLCKEVYDVGYSDGYDDGEL